MVSGGPFDTVGITALPSDKARAIDALAAMLGSLPEVASRLGLTLPTVRRYWSLLDLAPELQQRIETGNGPAQRSRATGNCGAVSSPEATSVVFGDQRLLTADLELLHGPAVPVRIAETEERPAVVGREHHDLAALDATTGQLLAGGLRVGDNQLQAPHRTRGHLAL